MSATLKTCLTITTASGEKIKPVDVKVRVPDATTEEDRERISSSFAPERHSERIRQLASWISTTALNRQQGVQAAGAGDAALRLTRTPPAAFPSEGLLFHTKPAQLPETSQDTRVIQFAHIESVDCVWGARLELEGDRRQSEWMVDVEASTWLQIIETFADDKVPSQVAFVPALEG